MNEGKILCAELREKLNDEYKTILDDFANKTKDDKEVLAREAGNFYFKQEIYEYLLVELEADDITDMVAFIKEYDEPIEEMYTRYCRDIEGPDLWQYFEDTVIY